MIKLYTDAAIKNDQVGLGILIVHNEHQYQLKQKQQPKTITKQSLKLQSPAFQK